MTNLYFDESLSLPLLTDADEAKTFYHSKNDHTDAERALVITKMFKDGLSNAEIRSALKIRHVYTVTHLKRVGINLSEDEMQLWHQNSSKITLGHLRAIAKFPRSKREPLIRNLLAKRVPVQEYEKIARGSEKQNDLNIQHYEQTVGEHIGRPTKINYNSRQGFGSITLRFYGLEDLEDIVAKLGYSPTADDSF